MIVWLSGQSGSGKTTLSKLIFKKCIRLDGDVIRRITFNKDYTNKGRLKNIKLAYYLSIFLSFLGFNVVVALVSPYCKYRDKISKKGFLFVLQSERLLRKEYHTKHFELPKTEHTIINTDKSVYQSLSYVLKVIKTKVNNK